MHASANPIALNAAKGLLQWREMRVVTSSLTVLDGFARRSGDGEGSRPAFYAGAQGQNSRFAPTAGSEPAFRARRRRFDSQLEVTTHISYQPPGQNSQNVYSKTLRGCSSSRSKLSRSKPWRPASEGAERNASPSNPKRNETNPSPTNPYPRQCSMASFPRRAVSHSVGMLSAPYTIPASAPATAAVVSVSSPKFTAASTQSR